MLRRHFDPNVKSSPGFHISREIILTFGFSSLKTENKEGWKLENGPSGIEKDTLGYIRNTTSNMLVATLATCI